MPIFYVKETLIMSFPHTHRCVAVTAASRLAFEANMRTWNESSIWRYTEVPESCLNRLFTLEQIKSMRHYGSVEWPKDK